MLRAITHKVSSRIADCQLTFLERTPIDYELAARQHETYENKLAELGIQITQLTDNGRYPDASFVEDTAIVLDEVAIICSMGVESRRGETQLIAQEFSKFRELEHISLPATIEGGDVLRVGRRVLVGMSSRTNREGVDALTRIAAQSGYEVIPVSVKGSLHLKSACSALNDETLLMNPEWIDGGNLSRFHLINTPPEEPESANVLRIGSTVCVQEGFPRTAELVHRIADRVEIINMSELRKAEAGLTCCSIIFET